MNERIGELFPRTEGNQVRALPNLDNGAPQIRITPDLAALARAGVSVRDVTSAVDVFNDGANVIQIPIAGELIDLVVAGKDASKLTAAELGDIPVVTRSGSVLKLGQLAEIEIISAPQQIRRISGRQAISLRLRPTEALPLEKAVEIIETQLIAEIRPQASEAGVSISLSGAASALNATWEAMQANVMIALGVIFLLMVVLLRNFVLPLIILLAVPVAAAGGIAGLALLNNFIRQPLDMLTMLGFVILTGVVVNNAILMIEQAMLHIREEAMDVADAVVEATRNRVRPIFMSTLTSLFGLVPLVIFPGAGAELYRGLGVVVFGGLGLSTLATLIIVPPLLALALRSPFARGAGAKAPLDVSAV